MSRLANSCAEDSSRCHNVTTSNKLRCRWCADQHHLHASYQICAEADFFKTEKVAPHSGDESVLFKVGAPAQMCACGHIVHGTHAASIICTGSEPSSASVS